MPRLAKMIAGPGGWCEWQAPHLKRYLMGCCDCGLVHEMEFRIVQPKGKQRRGYVKGDPVPGARVLFRARRSKKATEQQRKQKGKRVTQKRRAA